MSCFHPLPAFQDRNGGGVRIGYHAGEQGDKLELPCGRCIGCKQAKAKSWAIRCMHEAQLHDSNLFVTVDYAPEHLPASLSLEYGDFQGFLRRLRKAQGAGIRFFVSGEYGEQFGRPHWHALLFNCVFSDMVRYANGTFRSAKAERLWARGQVVIGAVTSRSAAYCAGYTLGKVYGSAAADFYEDVVNTTTGEVSCRRPPFCVMSRRPGIGAKWYERFRGDVLPGDFAVLDGAKYKVPQFYWRKFQAEGDPSLVEQIAYARFLRAKAVDPNESSERRRSDREQVALSRVKTFSRRGF